MNYKQTQSTQNINNNYQRGTKNSHYLPSFLSVTNSLQKKSVSMNSYQIHSLPHNVNLPSSLSELTMTIKQQQTIQSILKQTQISQQKSKKVSINKSQNDLKTAKNTEYFDSYNVEQNNKSQQNNYQLDDQIQKMLKQSQQKICKEYQNMTQEQVKKNRMAIQVHSQQEHLLKIFQRMDAMSQTSMQIKQKINDENLQNNNINEIRQTSQITKRLKQDYQNHSNKIVNNQQHQQKKINIENEGLYDVFNIDLNKSKLSYDSEKLLYQQNNFFKNNKTYSQPENIQPKNKQDINYFNNESYNENNTQLDENANILANINKTNQPLVQQQYVLDTYEKDHILRLKQKQKELVELNQKYLKINAMSMYKHQYKIFNFSDSSISKYLKHLKKSITEINCALSFLTPSNIKWTILAIQHLLYLFVSDDWKQPIIFNPQRILHQINYELTYKIIKTMTLSPNNNYLALSLGSEIIIYQIKKQVYNLVLVKNLNGTDSLNQHLSHVTKLVFYDQNPLKIAYIDNQQVVGVITVEVGRFFTTVTEKQIFHEQDNIIDISVLNVDNSNIKNQTSGINQKITNFLNKIKITYLVLTSRTTMMLYKIQPSLQLIQSLPLYEKTNKEISIRWRSHSQTQSKPQLLISYNNKIYIYKLIDVESRSLDGRMKSQQVYLELYLMYQNHYDIIQMQIISNTHVLLLSDENIIVIAVPLIPSTDLSILSNQEQNEQTNKKQITTNHEMFESAIVFLSSIKNCKILLASCQQILYCSNPEESLKIAKLKKLKQYLDDLMLHQGNFRQAITLLILIYKGVNFSFKFSYLPQELKQCISTTITCTIDTLILSVDDSIVQYRLGWICQLLFQTQNQSMMWSTVHGMLKKKQKQRQRQQQLQNTLKFQQNQYQLKKTTSKQINNKFVSANIQLVQNKKQNKGKYFTGPVLRKSFSQNTKPVSKHHKNLQYILFDVLQVFVLKSQVCQMPGEVFIDFIAYECQKMSDTVIQKIITKNNQSYDDSKLATLLQNKQQHYLQLFLFSRALICEQPDFYTPFIKVFSSLKKYVQRLKTRNKNNIQEEGELQQKIYMTNMMCLWYIRKCIKFEKIPQGIMLLNQKLLIITTMCVQILEQNIINRLFEFNQKIFLQIYLLLFINTQISQYINQNNQYLVQKYQQFYPDIYHLIMSTPPSTLASKYQNKVGNHTNMQNNDKTFKELALIHLQKTLHNIKNYNLYWAEFQALTFYFNSTQLYLSFQTIIDILIILFENKFQNYNLQIPSKIQNIPSPQNLQIFLINHIKPILTQRKDRLYITKLINFNDNNIIYHLHRIDRNYQQALQYFVNIQNIHKLIPFIYQILQDVKQLDKQNASSNSVIGNKNLKDKKLAEIKQFLRQNIGILFKIDKDKALNIFYQLGETSQTIYNMLQQKMQQKLDFLTSLLKRFEHEDFPMKQRFQLQHLSQVCKLKNKQVLQYLDKFYYPLDQGIIVCQQKGNLLAKAILQQRCGKICDAFMSYQRIVKNIVQSNSSHNSNQQVKSEKQIISDVNKYIKQCIRLCKKSPYDQNSSPQQNYWLRIITFINSFIKSNNQHKIYLIIQFQKILQNILNQMFHFLPTNILIDFFITKGHRLQLTVTKQYSIYRNLFMLVIFDICLNKHVLEICKLDIKNTRKQYQLMRKHGTVSFGLCDFCRKLLSEQYSCNIFNCSHSFHQLCHQDTTRCLSCYYKSDDSIYHNNIYENYNEKIMQYSNQYQRSKNHIKLKQIKDTKIIFDQNNVIQHQNVKKKMKVFDFLVEQDNSCFYQNLSNYEIEPNIEDSSSNNNLTNQKKQQITNDKPIAIQPNEINKEVVLNPI